MHRATANLGGSHAVCGPHRLGAQDSARRPSSWRAAWPAIVAGIALSAAIAFAGAWRASLGAPAPKVTDAVARPGFGPVTGFVANHGQWRAGVRFAIATDELVASVTDSGIALHPFDGDTVSLCFERSAPTARAVGVERAPGLCHFLRGADPERWVRDVPVWRAVALRGVGEDLDVVVRRAGRRLEYDLELGARADLADVVCRVDGASRLSVDDDGALRIETAHGTLRQPRPHAELRTSVGASRPVECSYVVLDDARFGFSCAGRGVGDALWIDPPLHWSSFVGGARTDDGFAVAALSNGDAVVAGSTLSPDFPTTSGAFDSSYNGSFTQPRAIGDVCVARLRAEDGALVFATFLGGAENEFLVAIEPAGTLGDVVVTGWTTSTDYPTTAGAFDTTYNGTGDGYRFWGGDIFVTRLAADGRSLRFSTYVGGNDLEYPTAMAVDAAGNVTFAGHVHSLDFPTTPGAWMRTMRGSSEAYVTRLDATGSTLLFSTLFGGVDGEEYPFGLAIDASGGTLIGGATDSTDLPVTANAFDRTFNGGNEHFADGFLARFDATASTLLYATYLGSPGDEYVRDLTVEPDGTATVTGSTNGAAFPTTAGAFDRTPGGGTDVFVTRVAADGSALVWSTLVGGLADDVGYEVTSLGGGRVAVAGLSASADFPTTPGAFDRIARGVSDGVVFELSADGSALHHSTRVAGRFDERLEGIAPHPDGGVVVSGTSYSPDFPTTPGAWDRTNRGSGDIVVARLSLLPVGCERTGRATAGCAGTPRTGARGGALRGDPDFALTCSAVTPGATGALFVGVLERDPPLQILGVALSVDPLGLIAPLPALGDAHGGALVALPVPDDSRLVGARLVAQFVWPDACAPANLSASSGVRVVLQP